MSLKIEVPMVMCTNCKHYWVPRSNIVRKCPFCQRPDHMQVISLTSNRKARELIGTATDKEIEDLATVLRILRTGDFLTAESVRRAIAFQREHEDREARTFRTAYKKRSQ